MVGPFEIIIVWYFLQNVLINWFKYILQYNSNILVNFFTLNWTLVGFSEVFGFYVNLTIILIKLNAEIIVKWLLEQL